MTFGAVGRGHIFGVDTWMNRIPDDPETRCIDGIPPEFLTCQGHETTAPEPYMLKVLGDHTPFIMCEAHRADSQRDADESTITHNDIRFPRYQDD